MFRMQANDIQVFLRATSGVSLASAKELVRSGLTVVIILLSFGLILGIFIVIDFLFPNAPQENLSFQNSLGVISMMGMSSVAFTGTAVPLVSYRERGTLRLLSSTPLSRFAFLSGQLPIRAAIVLVELIILCLVMLTLGAHDFSQFFGVIVTTVCGFLMFMSLGVLLGSRGTNADFTMQLSLLIPVIVIFTSGIAIPLESFPGWVSSVIHFLPTTWFMEAFNTWTGRVGAVSIQVYWVCMAGASLISMTIASRCFDWGRTG